MSFATTPDCRETKGYAREATNFADGYGASSDRSCGSRARTFVADAHLRCVEHADCIV
jgi:hypothetical protein